MQGYVGFSRYAKFAWVVLAYTLLTVAWGAVVRATFSGDGCGSHWPLCDGKVVPEFASYEQIFEFSHRVTSGLILPMVIALMVMTRRRFEPGHYARKAAGAALGLTMLEGGIGAALVRFGLVDKNDSFARAGVMSFHTVSTYLLITALAFVVMAAHGVPQFRWKGQGKYTSAFTVAFILMAFLGMSGAISALGHTLKPTQNVLHAASQSDAHWMVKLQPYHPALAAGIGLYLVLLGLMVWRDRPYAGKAVQAMIGVLGFQMVWGLLNIWTKAPVFMQAMHLVLADIQFASVAAMGAIAFPIRQPERVIAEAKLPTRESVRELVNAYVALTKPRVISLLLFTCVTAAFAAAGGFPGWPVFFGLMIGGYLMPGAANAINMVIDRDIDQRMERTAKRPTASSQISAGAALTFAFTIALTSFGILWATANLLTAMLALAGLLFYVIVYTMVLKRRTVQNIVIGGAAGCFPPLVGFAAVDNGLGTLAWILFAVIFVWTPVHFWALALLIKDDYAKAGVPMMPVVRGDQHTVVQIAAYTVVTVLVTIAPFLMKEVGWIYLASAILLNGLLIKYCAGLVRRIERPQASALFHYSMLYLALLFLMVAVDKAVLS